MWFAVVDRVTNQVLATGSPQLYIGAAPDDYPLENLVVVPLREEYRMTAEVVYYNSETQWVQAGG